MNELNLGGFEYTFISSNAQRGLSISVHHGKYNEFNSVDEEGIAGKKINASTLLVAARGTHDAVGVGGWALL